MEQTTENSEVTRKRTPLERVLTPTVTATEMANLMSVETSKTPIVETPVNYVATLPKLASIRMEIPAQTWMVSTPMETETQMAIRTRKTIR